MSGGAFFVMIVCFKPRALRAVTNAMMEAHPCFCFSAYGGKDYAAYCKCTIAELAGGRKQSYAPSHDAIRTFLVILFQS
jgi:hypothetical protein